MPRNPARSLFAQLNALADEIQTAKTAAVKSAGPTPADPGTYVGSSSHPTANVDNDVQNAAEGARAQEYAADIKKQQGPLSVDSTPELSQEGRQNEVQLNIGTNAKPTGEDPAAEKDFKGTKDDPGTSSPVKANDGEKYSSVTFKEARDRAGALGNDILANLINFGTANLDKQAEMPAFLKKKIEGKSEAGESKAHEAAESPAEETAEEANKAAAFKAGYELAAALGFDKEAAEANVREVCANTIREADQMADLVLGCFSAKSAAADPTEEASEGEDHAGAEDAGSGASDAPAGGAPAGLEAMMGGEEDPAAAGAAPAAAAGGGAPSDEEAMQELAMALEELGIPPEALIQALSEGGAGAGAGAPPMGGDPAAAGGMPPEAAPKMAADQKAAVLASIGREVLAFKRAGLFQVKEARDKRSRALRDNMKQHILELVTR